tara:strand:- start:1005 stop:1235 length:231 start_codon:yes stop_codon:yes gene_type:complete
MARAGVLVLAAGCSFGSAAFVGAPRSSASHTRIRGSALHMAQYRLNNYELSGPITPLNNQVKPSQAHVRMRRLGGC